MTTIKVTFSNKDEILAAIVRALAVQAAGFQVVGGLNKKYLETNGYYKFPFAGQDQAIRFQRLIRTTCQKLCKRRCKFFLIQIRRLPFFCVLCVLLRLICK